MEQDDFPASQAAADAYATAPHMLQRPDEDSVGPTTFAGFAAAAAGAAAAVGAPPPPPRPRPARVAADGAPRTAKLLLDPVHGFFRLGARSTAIFDTPQFQRLRRLKQLGLTYFVFPGASHNRFEHSLGVAHLARSYALQLVTAQPELRADLDRDDLACVELAGLCHDLGHGPFSHVFEREFLPRLGVTGWDHERMSADVLDHILDANHVEGVTAEHARRVKAMIVASCHDDDGANGGAQCATQRAGESARGGATRWLHEIVANGRSGIDVDKFDYLARDSLYCGVKIAADFSRVQQFSRVAGGEIVYKHTEGMALYEVFHSRATMHRAVYTHKKAKAIEFMVVDALAAAEPALRLAEQARAAPDFCRLPGDDALLEVMERWDAPWARRALGLEPEHEAPLRAAQAIMARLRSRRLYKYVVDAPVPAECAAPGAHWAAPSPEDVVACYTGSDFRLRAEDVIVQENRIDYSFKTRDPLENVRFFRSPGDPPGELVRFAPADVSPMAPGAFEEKRLRVFSRDDSPAAVRAAHVAFEEWLRRRWGGRVQASTPAKAARPPAPPPPPGGGAHGDAAGGKRQLFPPPLPPEKRRAA